MPIRPYDLNSQPELPDEIVEIMESSGLNAKVISNDTNIKNARTIFNKSGATLEAAADQVANLLNNADTAAGRLKAVELTMKVHGILQEMEDKPIPQIIINVLGSDNKTLVNLVLPTT